MWYGPPRFSMPPEDAIRVRHMIGAAESARRFIAGHSRADIDTDEQLRFALVQAVQIIGEAASRVSPETRSAMPLVPWTDIIFMRNRLVHAYFDTDHDVIWKTITEDIPPLLRGGDGPDGRSCPPASQSGAADHGRPQGLSGSGGGRVRRRCR